MARVIFECLGNFLKLSCKYLQLGGDDYGGADGYDGDDGDEGDDGNDGDEDDESDDSDNDFDSSDGGGDNGRDDGVMMIRLITIMMMIMIIIMMIMMMVMMMIVMMVIMVMMVRTMMLVMLVMIVMIVMMMMDREVMWATIEDDEVRHDGIAGLYGMVRCGMVWHRMAWGRSFKYLFIFSPFVCTHVSIYIINEQVYLCIYKVTCVPFGPPI